MKKLSVQQVNNGYVVKVVNQDVTEYKRLYEHPVHVFASLQEVAEFLSETFEEPVQLWASETKE